MKLSEQRRTLELLEKAKNAFKQLGIRESYQYVIFAANQTDSLKNTFEAL